jgi:hypothetical protein
METPFVTKGGSNTTYGLGIHVYNRNGHRELEHGGEVGGYVSENIVSPEDKVAVVVLTNEVASSAAAKIGAQVSAMLLPATVAPEAAQDEVAGALPEILSGLAKGEIDRGKFTANCNTYFGAEALADFQATLAPLGAAKSVYRTQTSLRGGMRFANYRVVFANGTTLLVETAVWPDGKLEQLLILGKA